MIQYFPDLLRAVITDVMLILLLCTMATPKYANKAVYAIAIAVVLVGNVGANFYFYRINNYTAVLHVDLAMLLVIAVAMKPLFSDTIMQWCFSYITVINIYAAIVFLSYFFSGVFPNPLYGNSILRLAMFFVVILVFRKWVSVPYRKVLNYWHIHLLPTAALLVCFLGDFLGGDILDRMKANYLSLFFLVLLGFSIYVSIIYSLKIITAQYAMREENQTIRMEREYLQLATAGMSERLKLMEDVSVQNARSAHDRRHFNSVLLGLLEQGKTGEMASLLKTNNQQVPIVGKVYCENPVVNAAVCHYAAVAENAGIKTGISIDIPGDLVVDSLELSMVVSNLMENAIHACLEIPQDVERYVRVVCRNVGRLLLEIENPCPDGTRLDDKGQPVVRHNGQGIGSKSVLAFANKYDAELIYSVEGGLFRVRLLV